MNTPVQRSSVQEIADALIRARLQSGQSMSFVVATSSMLPALAPGDRVIARGVDAEQVRVGEIAIVRRGELPLVHRVVECHRDSGGLSLITKGDNCTTADEAVPGSQLLGVVVAVERQTQALDLVSERARLANHVIALVSRCEWRAQNSSRSFAWRILRRALRCLMSATGTIAIWGFRDILKVARQ